MLVTVIPLMQLTLKAAAKVYNMRLGHRQHGGLPGAQDSS
jgi:hypothetical protein